MKPELRAGLSILLQQQQNKWVGFVPGLDIESQGHTSEEALKATLDAVDLFFEVCLARGTLESALTELGFQLKSSSEGRMAVHEDIKVPIQIPIEPLTKTHHGPTV
ncbi:MAG: hypothetical protein OEW12_09110 [Deltaproteobacteria bacterium]|nr:hypothetical protein [Deltaproteobacteria bacterium]